LSNIFGIHHGRDSFMYAVSVPLHIREQSLRHFFYFIYQ
jgi:hypothetical protein